MDEIYSGRKKWSDSKVVSGKNPIWILIRADSQTPERPNRAQLVAVSGKIESKKMKEKRNIQLSRTGSQEEVV